MSFKFIFSSILLFAIGFLAYKTIPLYYAYYDLKGQMEAQINKSDIFSDQEMRNNIFEKIQKLDIPVDKPEEVIIERTAEGVEMSVDYRESIDLEIGEKNYHLFDLEFSADVEK